MSCRYCGQYHFKDDDGYNGCLLELGICICDECWNQLKYNGIMDNVKNQILWLENRITYFLDKAESDLRVKFYSDKSVGYFKDQYSYIDAYKSIRNTRKSIVQTFEDKDIDFLLALIDVNALPNKITQKKMKEISGVPYSAIKYFYDKDKNSFADKSKLFENLKSIRDYYKKY